MAVCTHNLRAGASISAVADAARVGADADGIRHVPTVIAALVLNVPVGLGMIGTRDALRLQRMG